ncbi:MAG: hypothetical protein PVG49_13730 [Desulfobacteraceae bacterium]
MLYYTSHPLNFARLGFSKGTEELERCPFCHGTLPDCDCGYGSMRWKMGSPKKPLRRFRRGRARSM